MRTPAAPDAVWVMTLNAVPLQLTLCGLLLSAWPAQAATTVLSDVNIINEKEKNAIILLTNNDPETFPYDQAYGLTNYWTKWDVILNDDDTYSFHLNGKYLSADASGGVVVDTSIGTEEKFFLEEGNGSFYIRTWRDTYLSAPSSGWKDIVQSYTRTSREEWLFFERQDPTTGPQNVNISNYLYKTIIILLTNNDPETFPYDQAYGANNYWTKWDIVVNADGTYSFHLNGKYLANDGSTKVQVISSITDAAKFDLEASDRGTYYLRANDGRYLSAGGSGWTDVLLSSTPSDASRWHFFERQSVTTFADTEQYISAGTVSSVDDGTRSASFDAAFDSTPAFFSAMATSSGSDPAAVRVQSVSASGFSLAIQEEQSKDSETTHNPETVRYLAFAPGVVRNTAGAVVAEAGTLDVTQSSGSTWFTFSDVLGTYSDPVVIMVLNSKRGGDPAHIRLRNVDSDQFEYQVEEWDYLDGNHVRESVSYLIVESGTHSLERGGTLQAQTQRIDHDFEQVTFPSSFGSTPVVLSQSLTRNGSASIVTRQQSVRSTGVMVRLQEQEADNGTHDNEWVGIVSYAN